MIHPILLNVMGIKSCAARSRVIRTTRTLQIKETAGVFAGLAMGLSALATSHHAVAHLEMGVWFDGQEIHQTP